jgi:hypothetical protein
MQFIKRLLTFVIAAGSMAASQNALAVFTINVVETGGNVVATGSGTINMAGLSPSPASAVTAPSAALMASTASMALFADGVSPIKFWPGSVTGPGSFGTGPAAFANSGTGGIVILSGGNTLAVSNTYASGTPISNSANWAGTTFAGLGLTPGTYTYIWGTAPDTDSLILNVIASPPVAQSIPTLSEWGLIMMAGLLGMFGLAQVRRRR